MLTNAKPIFMKPRPVPIKLRDKLSDELQRLVNEGILSKANQSKRASPFVVHKKDVSLRIVGNFSPTYENVSTFRH